MSSFITYLGTKRCLHVPQSMDDLATFMGRRFTVQQIRRSIGTVSFPAWR
jgi:hypothetical protein